MGRWEIVWAKTAGKIKRNKKTQNKSFVFIQKT